MDDGSYTLIEVHNDVQRLKLNRELDEIEEAVKQLKAEKATAANKLVQAKSELANVLEECGKARTILKHLDGQISSLDSTRQKELDRITAEIAQRRSAQEAELEQFRTAAQEERKAAQEEMRELQETLDTLRAKIQSCRDGIRHL